MWRCQPYVSFSGPCFHTRHDDRLQHDVFTMAITSGALTLIIKGAYNYEINTKEKHSYVPKCIPGECMRSARSS